ncbi:MAG TPA: transglycosylase SLT domain-containing protein [Candidatus Competibacteraceae bacterium]|nr:transglycosylase SLT domain-containing protein [Candidatus Competibacteraceae bacterium]
MTIAALSRFLSGLWLLLTSIASHSVLADPLLLQRQQYLAAERALEQGNRTLYAILRDGLRDYPLYPYLLALELGQRLEQLPDTEVQDFLRQWGDTPPGRRLHAAWLRQLAKEQRWSDYLATYRDTADGTDSALDCWRRRALLELGQEEQALAGIERVWLQGRSLPDACDAVFARWEARGGLTAERLWQRFRLALDADQTGLARFLARRLPAAEQARAERWLAVSTDPGVVLDSERFPAADAETPTILLYALQRWAQRDSQAAAAALDALRPRYTFPAAALQALQRQLAVYLAGRDAPGAAQRLAALPPAARDDMVREWGVRLALRRGDWAQALTWLDSMPPAQAAQPGWRYWRARVLEALGRSAEAQTLYRMLAGERDYYGFLAAERMALPPRLDSQPLPAAAPQVTALSAQPGFRRARELLILSRLGEARGEWQAQVRALDPAQLPAAARLAHDWGWHDRAITTLAAARLWDDLELRFPLAYRATVLQAASANALDPAWIYAVIRQESLFQRDARSGAGALGLMQLLPATAQRMARELGEASTDSLLAAAPNIRYGSRYLRHTLQRLQDNPVLATAAYNAGPEKVRQWLPRQPMAADLWTELIPYAETRRYVQKVLEYTLLYQQRLGRNPSLADYMSLVQPQG